ncbi:MAG: hypothetical protein ACTHM8_05530, partial [Sphingomonas sp.]
YRRGELRKNATAWPAARIALPGRSHYAAGMEDIVFIALAEEAVRYVDDKVGRPAAWLAAIALVVVPIALIVGAALWLAG